MKLQHYLLASAATAFCLSAHTYAQTEPDGIGNIMYVGDSITHGFKAASYRWDLFKILTDNQIANKSVGVTSDNYQYTGTPSGTNYRGSSYINEHSAISGQRAGNTAGRVTSTRLEGSHIRQWLGLDATYEGKYKITPDKTPDTFVIMLGTNDMLGDAGHTQEDLANKANNMLGTYANGSKTADGDMDVIIKAMQESNPDATIYVNAVPTWAKNGNLNVEADATRAFTSEYNQRLEAWTKEYSNVKFIDVNKGLIDVASSSPFYAVSSMFGDSLHPNAQGDLIIAGNVAKGMGIAGRTAGLQRSSVSQMQVNFHQSRSSTGIGSMTDLTDKGFSVSNISVAGNKISFGNAGTSTMGYLWQTPVSLSTGYTVDILLHFGNGATDGWNNADHFTINIGNDSFYGTLNVNEAYIQWGDMILYSADMSANTDYIRISYLMGDSSSGIGEGYYVWLGDMLIGEALSTTTGSSFNGVYLAYGGNHDATVADIAIDGRAAYAPSSIASHAPIPEPGTAALGLLGLLFLACRRRGT